VALALLGTVVEYGGQAPEDGAGDEDPGGTSEPGSEELPPPPPRAVVTAADEALLTMRVTTIRVVGGLQFRVTRRVTLTVPASARLERPSGEEARFADLVAGDKLTVTTTAVEPSLAAQRARAGELVVERALLR
jgi:hypothetical protein